MERHADVVIAGGGLAGIVTAYELIERGRRVLLLDKAAPDEFGGGASAEAVFGAVSFETIAAGAP